MLGEDSIGWSLLKLEARLWFLEKRVDGLRIDQCLEDFGGIMLMGWIIWVVDEIGS